MRGCQSVSRALVSAGVVWSVLGSIATGAPNLVANGELEQPVESATARLSPTGQDAYFEFPGQRSFGRVIVHAPSGVRTLASQIDVSYSFVANAAGRTWGLGIGTKDVSFTGDYEIAIWFDLQGRILPNTEYTYSLLAIPLGSEGSSSGIPDMEMIVPALWADGELIGATVNLSWGTEDTSADTLAKRGVVKTPSFQQQTGGQWLILKLPRNFKGELFLDRVSLREIEAGLLKGEKPRMPTPTRYVDIESSLESRIIEALDRSAETLKSLQNDQGFWDTGEVNASVAASATILNSLAGRGEDLTTRKMRSGVKWVAEQEIENTQAVAARLAFLSRYALPEHKQAVAKDLLWLADAQFDDGGWTLISNEGNRDRTIHSDNQSTLIVCRALREAHYAGYSSDRRLWFKAADYWTKAQARDGGFRARKDEYGGLGEATTTHNTAAGLAGLLITLDMSFGAGGTRCDQYLTKREQILSINHALQWLQSYYDEDFKKVASLEADPNPFLNAAMMQTVTAVSGITHLNGKDVFRTEAGYVLDFFNPEQGLFAGNGGLTAQMLEMLSQGAAPVVFQRIIAGGTGENEYSRDGDHLVWYLQRERRKPLNWRATRIETPIWELVKVPILYVNVVGPFEWDDAAWQKIRRYCFAGGVVMFNIDERAEAQRSTLEEGLKAAFPEYDLKELGSDSKLRSLKHDLKSMEGIRVLGNGLKDFVVLLGEDWSCRLNLYQIDKHPETFQFVDNLLSYTLDDSPPRSSFAGSTWESGAASIMNVGVTQLEVGSKTPVYPDLVDTLDRSMQSGYRLKVDAVDPVASTGSGSAPRLLWLSCTGPDSIDAELGARIKQAIDGGAYLFAEVVSGNVSWDESFRSELTRLDGSLRIHKVLANHPVLTGQIPQTQGFDVREVPLRKALSEEYKKLPRADLYLIERDGVEIGMYSAHDISSGLGYVHFPDCRGVMPEFSRRIAANVLLHAMQQALD